MLARIEMTVSGGLLASRSRRRSDQPQWQGEFIALHSELIAVSWMDSKPVNMIATGCATTPASVTRREKGFAVLQVVPCPQLIADYHSDMGGVDHHDQLRLQRYSIQRCVAFKKYYRQLFLGFVDMVIVNGFIIHKIIMKKGGKPVSSHAEYMRRLHVDLLAVTAASLSSNKNAEYLVSVPFPPSKHTLEEQERKYRSKRRQHLCKVCSAMTPLKIKGLESRYFCLACEELHDGHVPLCRSAFKHARLIGGPSVDIICATGRLLLRGKMGWK
ncbi:unnamed protein product [Phytophthora fragariaefolia]|uniref:Unnamed protein product n=1 Tax=Phytophthora fragariaefolia TaxID=1490495 RepID=A0A9W6XJM8_9STRA|nr:unnamed protein product [Phytophthora fragariaefolia]